MLKKYYDLTVPGTKDFERLYLEGRIESENNLKLRQMMTIKDEQVSLIFFKMLKQTREDIGILEGYGDVELAEIVKGVITIFRGLFLEKLAGKDPQEIKKAWVRSIYIIYNSKKEI